MVDSNPCLPLDKIPSEIWLRIFLASIDGYRQGPGAPFIKPTSPFVLSAVCKDWRRLSLANTVMWDTINLWFGDLWEEDESYEGLKLNTRFKEQVETLKLWIKRAGARPLSITLSMDGSESFPALCDLAMEIPKVVVERAPQIQVLDICMWADWYSAFEGVEFPMLRTLKLFAPEIQSQNEFELFASLRTPISGGDDGGPILDFTGCPNLSVVEVNGSFDKSVGIVLPWSQITGASVSYIVPADCIEVLDLLPNLKRCTLELGLHVSLDEDDRVDWDREKRRESPALTELSLGNMLPEVIRGVLDSLPLSLQHLRLGALEEDDSPAYGFLQSIPAFAATLQSLVIYHTLPNWEPLAQLLPQLPGLQRLEIMAGERLQGLDESFFRQCFTTAGVLPRLESLMLTASGDVQLGDETLLNILRYRTHKNQTDSRFNCAKIQDVRIVLWEMHVKEARELQPATKAELMEMIEGGLNIVVEAVNLNKSVNLIRF